MSGCTGAGGALKSPQAQMIHPMLVHSDCYNKNAIRLAGFSNRNFLFSRITVLEAGSPKSRGLAALGSDFAGIFFTWQNMEQEGKRSHDCS